MELQCRHARAHGLSQAHGGCPGMAPHRWPALKQRGQTFPPLQWPDASVGCHQEGALTLEEMPLFCCCCSVTKSCLTLCNPMDCGTPGFLVLHHPPEFAQTHVHWVSDAIQPSHPLLPPSPSALNLFQHQALSIRWAEYWSCSIRSNCLARRNSRGGAQLWATSTWRKHSLDLKEESGSSSQHPLLLPSSSSQT